MRNRICSGKRDFLKNSTAPRRDAHFWRSRELKTLQKNNKKVLQKRTDEEEQDARFDKVYTDPRFVVAPSKLKKVEVDARFTKMYKDKEFNTVANVDKYGR